MKGSRSGLAAADQLRRPIRRCARFLPTTEADQGIALVDQSVAVVGDDAQRVLVAADGIVEVKVRAAEIDGIEIAQIKVEDNGPGFQTGSFSQVFDPYVTTKPKGTGLGLAIVKKLVEEHMGTIRAENRKDGGALISIRLPMHEAAREAMIAKISGRPDIRRKRV